MEKFHIIAKLSRSSIMLIQLRIKNSGKLKAEKGLRKNCALISLKLRKTCIRNIAPVMPKIG